MGKLLKMPLQILPYEICLIPTRAGELSRFVLLTTCRNCNDVATARGFLKLPDLLTKLIEMGVPRAILREAKASLEAGTVHSIPELWLKAPNMQSLQSTAVQAAH